MRQTIATVAYVVKDYDEAIKFFIETLGFDLIEDTCLEQEQSGKRWVVVKPRGPVGCSFELRSQAQSGIRPGCDGAASSLNGLIS
jgi:catechol 2,3-dioxygenase-like lactoylglutathione lyase family enzyme